MPYLIEFAVLIFSFVYTCKFLFKLYRGLITAWPSSRISFTRRIFVPLPIVSLFMIFFTLKVLASFDVINDGFYIALYIFLGFLWIYFGLQLMARFFDLSWIDDCLNLANRAAVISVAGGFIGLTIIYCGANIGDGPGWWCVIYAGGLGLVSWIALGLLLNEKTHVFERITIDRDISCAIRFGFYLIASGIVLARASAGDWTSFFMTVVKFLTGLPVLLLTGLAIHVERNYFEAEFKSEKIESSMSVFLGIVYVALAIIIVLLMPELTDNPAYDNLPQLFVKG